MKRLLTAVALATTLTLPAHAQNIAVINGKPVPSSRLDALVHQIERSGRPVDAAMREQLKEEVILREIFAQEAEKRGIKAQPEYRAQVELATQTILIRELFNDYQRKNPVTDAEIQAEYDKFLAANGGQEYRSRHILVETEDEAKALITQIKGGARFEELARTRSLDTGSGQAGGDLDWAGANVFVPEFSEAMIKLSKGQMTDTPVRSQFGWHIIRVDDIRQAELPSVDELRPQIEQSLQQQKLLDFQENLRAKAKIQ
ncbi:peptidylprolyl isomerase [Tepidicella baoligensis]|uniref:peptidylprolyl isomerase n=1 Tax=Tepidicella baoligensis TaxID=2707016 RepID=UPI0015D9A7B2|nr:peptidylprolyl isomerase [Tepidicella baoligensis]